jgi:ammonium transporter, Amt family
VAFQIVKFVVGIRVTEEDEREGLDISWHGERPYDL